MFNNIKLFFFSQLLSMATFFGAIFCFAAFCLKNMYGFLVLFAIGELLVFATQVHIYKWIVSNLFDGCLSKNPYDFVVEKNQLSFRVF